MYTYKTEILTVGTKWLSDKADANDIAMLDNLINERAADGWELVTYDYMATSMQIKGAFVVTFRKEKDDIFTQSSTNLFETLDVRYSITDKKELENSNGFGNYSIRAEEDNSYVISIGAVLLQSDLILKKLKAGFTVAVVRQVCVNIWRMKRWQKKQPLTFLLI